MGRIKRRGKKNIKRKVKTIDEEDSKERKANKNP